MTSVTININVGGQEEKKEPQNKAKALRYGDRVQGAFLIMDGTLFCISGDGLVCLGAQQGS